MNFSTIFSISNEPNRIRPKKLYCINRTERTPNQFVACEFAQLFLMDSFSRDLKVNGDSSSRTSIVGIFGLLSQKYIFAFINIGDPVPNIWHVDTAMPMSQVSTSSRMTKEWKEGIWYSSIFCLKKFVLQSSHVAHQNANREWPGGDGETHLHHILSEFSHSAPLLDSSLIFEELGVMRFGSNRLFT